MVLDLLAGVQTPNCIRATAFDAVAHDYPTVTVLSDATAGQTEAIHSGRILSLQFELKSAALQYAFLFNCFSSPSR
jgi:nicotinamidase-related amidase